MKIYANQLEANLNQAHNFFILVGQQPFLLQQSTQKLQSYAQNQGYEDRVVFILDSPASFDWQAFTQALASPSLFAPKQVIEWVWQNTNLSDKHLAEIMAYLPPMDHALLIVRAGAMSKAQLNAKWFKEFSDQALVIDHWPPRTQELPRYIQAMAQAKQLKLTHDIAQLLSSRYEGRLDALDQLLEKLALSQQTSVSLAQVEAHLDEQYQFDVFSLQSALLSQNHQQVICILNHLKQSNAELSLILWCIHRLIQSLYLAQSTQPTKTWLQSRGIWPKDQPGFMRLCQKPNLKKWENDLRLLAKIDGMQKTGQSQQCWQDLCIMCLNLISAMPQKRRWSVNA